MAVSVSNAWRQFVRRGFHPLTVVDVAFPGEGTVYPNLPVSSGEISFARNTGSGSGVRGSSGNGTRASGNITVPDPDLFPALDEDSPIAPYGAELIIRSGILYPRGAALRTHRTVNELEDEGLAEMVPMGRFIIVDGSGSEREGNVTNLEFTDRAFLIDDMDHVRPKDYGGALAFDVLEEIITDPDPFVDGQMSWVVHIDGSLENITLPRGTTFDTGRWSFIQEIAQSIGAEVFFGRDGDCYIQPIPSIDENTLAEDANWVISSGPEGVLVDLERTVTREDTYNGVVVVGSGDGERPQPWAFVTDDNEASRTFYGGPFGKVVIREDMSDLTTDAQCENAAKGLLREGTGLQRTAEIDTFGNPAMDPGDVLLIQPPNGDDELRMLDGFTYDFASADMSGINTRSIQFVEES